MHVSSTDTNRDKTCTHDNDDDDAESAGGIVFSGEVNGDNGPPPLIVHRLPHITQQQTVTYVNDAYDSAPVRLNCYDTTNPDQTVLSQKTPILRCLSFDCVAQMEEHLAYAAKWSGFDSLCNQLFFLENRSKFGLAPVKPKRYVGVQTKPIYKWHGVGLSTKCVMP